jgi:hypothetical protein
MGLVVAARFDSFAMANSAAHALFADGFREDAVNIFYVGGRVQAAAEKLRLHDPDPVASRYNALMRVALLGTLGTMAGASIALAFATSALVLLGASSFGAFLGSGVGALWVTGRGRTEAQGGRLRPPNVLLTVQTEWDEEDAVGEMLRDAGGVDVERARGRWSHGSWIESEVRAPQHRRHGVVAH